MRKERFRIAAASYLALIQNGKILLSKRKNTGWMDGSYTLVAGHIEADENPTQAIIREAREEAGIKVRPDDLKMVHIGMRQRASENDNTYVDFYMKCTRWQDDVRNMEPEKCAGLEWFPLAQLPEDILPFLKEALGCVGRGEIYSETTQ